MNKQLNNLEVIAEMANLKLKASVIKVFQVVDDSVMNVENRFEGNDLNLTENCEKKLFELTMSGHFEICYSIQEAVDLLIYYYTPADEI
jgi:hypothetical protein